jgi:hypothetical protein
MDLMTLDCEDIGWMQLAQSTVELWALLITFGFILYVGEIS